MTRRAEVFGVLVLLLGGLAVASYGEIPGRRVLPGGEERFDMAEPAWAQGDQVHLGDETFDIGDGWVRGMLATPRGFFLTVQATDRLYDDSARLVWFDGERLVDVPGLVSGDVSGVAVSPDGRHAGWVDRQGPWTVAGRIAEVVVVDLATGEAVFRDHEHMGGGWGDDIASLYSELDPRFVGFDDEGLAYWSDGDGGGERWRVDLATGARQEVETDPGSDDGHPIGEPYNPRLGRVTEDLQGWESPDGLFEVSRERPQQVLVTTSTGRRVRLDHGRRNAFFGGWVGSSTLHALVTDDYRGYFELDPSGDTTRGTLVACRLPSGRCTELTVVQGLQTFTFGHGAPPTGGL